MKASWIENVFGVSLDAFNEDVRGRACVQGRSVQLVGAGLLDWGKVNELVDAAGTRLDVIHLVREGRRLDRSHYVRPSRGSTVGVITAPSVSRAIRDGYSLLLDQIDSYYRPARDLADQLSNELGESVFINTYVSWTSTKCFPTHWDNHDVFILQTEGEKDWTVFRPTRLGPLREDVEFEQRDRVNLDIAWEGRLKKGDVLYIPRGWWHHAAATNVGSIHMTCGFTSRTGIDLLTYLTERACDDPVLRQDLLRPERASGLASVDAAIVERLVAFVRETCDADFLQRYWRQHFALLPAKERSLLPFTITQEEFAALDHALASTFRAPFVVLEMTPDSIVLEAGKRRLELSRRAGPLIELFLAGDVRWLSALELARPGDLSAEEVTRLAHELVCEGVLYIEESVAREQDAVETPADARARGARQKPVPA